MCRLVVTKPFDITAVLVAGVDVSITGKDTGSCCIVVLDSATLGVREVIVEEGKIDFPYVPGFLSFREGPLFLKALSSLKHRPDVFFFDGQGIAHPRRFGLASHMGLLLDIPTVGVAKSRLVGRYREPDPKKGSWNYLEIDGEKVGAVVRTRERVKPVFVSPGHFTDVASSVRLTMFVTGRYRIPEPTRLAHVIAKKASH